MNFEIDAAIQGPLAALRERGRTEARPIGLEADRLGRPIPVDDPYFAKLIARGEGRTRWRGPDGEKKARSKPKSAGSRPSVRTVKTLLFVEELAYWDRGVVVANPGVGLPEANVIAMGTDEQKERFLGPFLAPDRPRWACFAMTEPGAPTYHPVHLSAWLYFFIYCQPDYFNNNKKYPHASEKYAQKTKRHEPTLN